MDSSLIARVLVYLHLCSTLCFVTSHCPKARAQETHHRGKKLPCCFARADAVRCSWLCLQQCLNHSPAHSDSVNQAHQQLWKWPQLQFRCLRCYSGVTLPWGNRLSSSVELIPYSLALSARSQRHAQQFPKMPAWASTRHTFVSSLWKVAALRGWEGADGSQPRHALCT